jgi:hypothetical protein
MATATPTPLADHGQVLILTPAAAGVGWAVSREAGQAQALHPGDSFLYAGRWDNETYRAMLQFDLAELPRGVEVLAASLRLTGLRADQLDPDRRAEWQVQILPTEIDYRWAALDYEQLAQADPWATLAPQLSVAELGAGQVNVFEFTAEQLVLLERRLLEGSELHGQKISFRLDGPARGPNNLFAWDSGYGPDSQGQGPELFLSVGSPPLETPLPYVVVITSTPTPETVLTAEALSLQMTAQAKLAGTATPLPPYWVTPLVVTATPLPQNAATAQAMLREATAIARTTGVPSNLAIASPTPTYVIVTSTPTPLNLATAQIQALQAQGATPLPENWVTPFVVTSTPIPQNTATAQYQRAVALTTGTPTLPANLQTATPTPPAFEVSIFASPTATATPSPTPQPLPAILLGKILFLSDREGASEEERQRAGTARATPQIEPQPYAYDPATGQLERLTAMWPYQVARAREGWSADERYETYNKALLWTNVRTDAGNVATEEFAVHYYDYLYNTEQIVSKLGAGIAYDPVWSPVSDEIAFVATESGNDEIWRINRDGSQVLQLTRNDWEWDKHPSWSPDGQQLVFYSNRTGANQLWMMNRDGSEQRPLMEANPYNDWDPIWVKSLAPAPPPNRLPDWRFNKPTD